MKVSEAIKILNGYKPDDDIYIEWWGKEMFDHDEDNPIDSEDWHEACEVVQNNPSEWAMGLIFDQLESALYDQKKDRV